VRPFYGVKFPKVNKNGRLRPWWKYEPTLDTSRSCYVFELHC